MFLQVQVKFEPSVHAEWHDLAPKVEQIPISQALHDIFLPSKEKEERLSPSCWIMLLEMISTINEVFEMTHSKKYSLRTQ